jgi:3-oxoadipate enol-lactonase
VIPHYRVEGPADGSVVVLSGSLGTALEVWDAQAFLLVKAGFRVVRFDARGHGGSATPPAPYAIADLGRDALELLDDLALERAAFCGLSLGGAVGMWLALQAPERLDSLALCCTSAHFAPPQQWRDRAALVRSDGLEAIADSVLGRWFTPRFPIEHPALLARLRASFVATSREGYAGCCEALAGWDARSQLGAIRLPTLVVAGAEDPVASEEHVRLLEGAIPGAQLVTLDGAAHLANVEQPRRFADALLSHLRLGIGVA